MNLTTDNADEVIGESGNDAAASPDPISSEPAQEKRVRKGRYKLQPVPPVDVGTLAGWRRTLFYIEQVCCILTVVSALIFMFFVALDEYGVRFDVFYLLGFRDRANLNSLNVFTPIVDFGLLFNVIIFFGFLAAVLVTAIIVIVRSTRALAGKKCKKGAEGMMISSALCYLTYAMYF